MKKSLTPLLGVLAVASATTVMASKSPQSLSAHELQRSITEKTKRVYVVRLKDKSLIEYDGDMAGFAATRPSKGQKINPKDADVLKYSAHIEQVHQDLLQSCLLYTSPSPRDLSTSRMPSSA